MASTCCVAGLLVALNVGAAPDARGTPIVCQRRDARLGAIDADRVELRRSRLSRLTRGRTTRRVITRIRARAAARRPRGSSARVQRDYAALGTRIEQLRGQHSEQIRAAVTPEARARVVATMLRSAARETAADPLSVDEATAFSMRLHEEFFAFSDHFVDAMLAARVRYNPAFAARMQDPNFAREARSALVEEIAADGDPARPFADREARNRVYAANGPTVPRRHERMNRVAFALPAAWQTQKFELMERVLAERVASHPDGF